MLSAHKTDYNMFQNYFVPSTNKENNTFDTPHLKKSIKKTYLPKLIQDHNNPP